MQHNPCKCPSHRKLHLEVALEVGVGEGVAVAAVHNVVSVGEAEGEGEGVVALAAPPLDRVGVVAHVLARPPPPGALRGNSKHMLLPGGVGSTVSARILWIKQAVRHWWLRVVTLIATLVLEATAECSRGCMPMEYKLSSFSRLMMLNLYLQAPAPISRAALGLQTATALAQLLMVTRTCSEHYCAWAGRAARAAWCAPVWVVLWSCTQVGPQVPGLLRCNMDAPDIRPHVCHAEVEPLRVALGVDVGPQDEVVLVVEHLRCSGHGHTHRLTGISYAHRCAALDDKPQIHGSACLRRMASLQPMLAPTTMHLRIHPIRQLQRQPYFPLGSCCWQHMCNTQL
jgi:hypothetical protein